MYVKSLTLKGFKSFADPVTLDLQPGVNVVVGPNGSGKSNVIDAVAWVLGAQGARALRGGKMDDVIFAGTGKRSALGRAEVSLTIDNSDHKIPVEFSEVTITRTLFRTGESEYAINGVGCRLLDIQELLSDSGVGRQQHVIVSQGNLDAVLTARPEDRRMIIEEAAGVLKYRKRREKSQRRLESTEGNLERLQDLVREVRQQLRPLQKQAEAAMRHGDVTTELQAIRLYVAGRDIDALQHRQNNAEAEAAQIIETDATLRAQLTESDQSVASAEGVMAGLSTEDLGDQVERLERIFQRAKGMSALMAERRRSLERDLTSSVSQDVVAALESDASNVRIELQTVEGERAELIAPSDELGHVEQALASDWIEFEEEWGEGLPVSSNEAAQLRGESASIAKSVESLENEVARRNQRVEELRGNAASLISDIERLTAEQSEVQGARASLEENKTQTEQATIAAQAKFEQCDAAFGDARQRLSVAQARAQALNEALDESRARAGVERLSSIDGVVGTLSELVEIDDGYQAAFEAAAGEAMAAVVVESVDSAQEALAHLLEAEADGAVLVLGQEYGPAADDHHSELKLDNLRRHIRGRSDAVDQLLDRLLCCAVVTKGGWHEAVDVALEYPDLIVVSERGDRFSRGGWRIGTGGSGATSAAVEQAQVEAASAQEAADAAAAAMREAKEQRDRAAASERAANNALIENERQTSTALAALERSQSRKEGLDVEVETIESNVVALATRLTEEQARLQEIVERLPALEAAEASGEERARMWREARAVLEERSGQVRVQRSQLEVQAQALEERKQFLTRRLIDLETRLEEHNIEVGRATQRREQIEYSIRVIDRLRAIVDGRIDSVEVQLAEVRERRNVERERRRVAAEALDGARRERSSLERSLLELGEKKQQHEVRLAEIRLRLEAVLETLERELEVEPEVAINAPEPELPDGRTAKQRMAELEGELRRMGPINPLALEEFNAVQERHVFLDSQLQDVQESRRELLRVIRAVDAEIQETFSSAYEDVAKNFEQLFGTLFPGGAGNLKLTDPENPLETGIEIEAKPSGKNVRTLSLLSGGERSLAAMAFLFAVFRSRPSPFYLLDEVEAPLDDINLSRFLMLVEEFRSEAQLVIVTHQKRTMEVADCLYGVSMQVGGSSKVVSERLEIDLTKTA